MPALVGSDGPILLTGVNGQVGGACLPVLRRFGEVIAPTRADLDLTDADAIRDLVRRIRPRWIVNPAAYTAVDKAEADTEAAYRINRDAPRVLGEEAARLGAAVLHFSTDYVFSGEGTEPWREDDATGPLGVYGASKLAGEEALAASGAAHLIFRTSWVFSPHGRNFLLTILRLARERDEMKIVADQHGAPTSAHCLANLAAHTVARCESQAARTGSSLSEAVHAVSGVYHAANAGETTWFGFASEFLALAREAEPAVRFARLTPIRSSDYPTPARRPANSRLNCDKLAQELGFRMPSWQQATAEVMAEVLAGQAHEQPVQMLA